MSSNSNPQPFILKNHGRQQTYEPFPDSNSTSKIVFEKTGKQHPQSQKNKAAMAEWFKAADLRPAIIDAWVRTPLAAKGAKHRL